MQGMEDWRVHEGNTVVGGGNDGDGVLIRDDVGARWPTHQTGESDSPRHATWKGACVLRLVLLCSWVAPRVQV